MILFTVPMTVKDVAETRLRHHQLEKPMPAERTAEKMSTADAVGVYNAGASPLLSSPVPKPMTTKGMIPIEFVSSTEVPRETG